MALKSWIAHPIWKCSETQEHLAHLAQWGGCQASASTLHRCDRRSCSLKLSRLPQAGSSALRLLAAGEKRAADEMSAALAAQNDAAEAQVDVVLKTRIELARANAGKMAI